MSDLVKRLREVETAIRSERTFPSGDERDMVVKKHYGPDPLSQEAATAIEALQAENARLREALEKISNLMPDDCSPRIVEVMVGRIARAALTDPAAPLPSPRSTTETDER